MGRCRVSVIMAVYNGERYVREAVDSILNQTFTDLEFIIVDDGSTDRTDRILNTYDDPRIVRVRNEENIGLTRCLNKGLTLARGRYIARQDADDVSVPERLQMQVDFLDGHPEVALVGTSKIEIDDQGNSIKFGRVSCDDAALRRCLPRVNSFVHGSVLLRRGALKQVGGYRPIFSCTQDYDLWIRIAERYRVANLEQGLYAWRCHHGSISLTRRAEQVGYADLARELALERYLKGSDRYGYPSVLPALKNEFSSHKCSR